MNLVATLQLLRQAVGIEKILDTTHWSLFSVQSRGQQLQASLVSIAVARDLNIIHAVVKVTVPAAGEDQPEQEIEMDLKAVPGTVNRAHILVNDARDMDANLTFDYAGRLGNLSRWAFDFVNVTVDGVDYRVNLRFDP
jgi:hypothetical protein